jgi:glycosyltransferase involved in cell wall biosynthesis
VRCRIAIPTFNRARLLGRAIRSALDQSHTDIDVLVVDDGSTDDTAQVVAPFLADSRFSYVRLARNAGTAAAKNVAIALGDYDAITFHDSDDIAERDKLLRQAAVLQLQGVNADPILNWSMAGREPGGRLAVGAALTQHWLLDADGGRRRITRSLSLVDDFFPHLQMNAGPLGDWILINPGLFRRGVFARVGGFERCVEEDRELRNRLLMHGEVIWLVEEPLLTKVECADGLTVGSETGYRSPRRERDRNLVWDRAAAWRAGGAPPVSPIDLGDVEIAEISSPRLAILANDLPIKAPPRMPL